MATEAIEQAPGSEAEAAPAPAAGKKVLMLAVAGIVAGSAAGLFGVGPILAKRKAAPHVAEKVDEKAAPVTHAIENIVLNPAGSGGTRFLMVTATFELKDASVEQLMKDREAEIRDRLLALLGKKTVEELTEMGERERMKTDVLAMVAPLFPKGAIRKVFFPQFVIQ